MANQIENVIGTEEAEELRKEFNELLYGEEVPIMAEFEDLLLDYGLEMDYFDQLM